MLEFVLGFPGGTGVFLMVLFHPNCDIIAAILCRAL
jgi:hypothetical protein